MTFLAPCITIVIVAVIPPFRGRQRSSRRRNPMTHFLPIGRGRLVPAFKPSKARMTRYAIFLGCGCDRLALTR